MALHTFRKREGLRKVYRAASASEAARTTYLDGLADIALATANSGKTLVSVSAGGSSSSYAVFSGWACNDVLEFVDWCRDYIALSTIALAIVEVAPRVARFQTSTTNLRVVG